MSRRRALLEHEADLARIARELDGGDWWVVGFAGLGAAVVLIAVLAWWLT